MIPEAIVIPDPELLLPDERLPSGVPLIAHSSFFGGEYPSLAALVKRRQRVEQELALGLADWHASIEPTCWVTYSVRNDATGERMFVFGYIPDVEALLKTGRVVTGDLTALRRLRRKIEYGLKRGWLYGQWFSRTQPEGPWGVIHKRFLQSPMSEAEFESFRARGWVTGEEGIPT